MSQINLSQIFADRVASKLQRRSVTNPARWAESYRILGGDTFPGPWGFHFHPWLKEMHTTLASRNVGMKAAQCGYTETMLNICFFKLDVESVDCLYILPNKIPDCADFSSARFNTALDLSSHIGKMFTDTNNIGHKKCGSANLYIRGSQSKAGLRSIPVSVLFVDEVSAMNQENITLALERTSGQFEKLIWLISTPTIEDENIDREYKNSTQEHFHFKCPCCNKWTEFIFPDCVEIIGENVTDPRIHESFYKCKECNNPVPYDKDSTKRKNAEAKADWISNNQWVPSYSDRDTRGFYVNQIYSPTITPGELVRSYLKGLINPSDEQEFYNSKLGVTHAVEGARVNDKELADAKKTSSHKNTDPAPKNALVTMGIDVGNSCYYEIDQWFLPKNWHFDHPELAICKVIRQGFTEKDIDFSQLDSLMQRYSVTFCVIDSQPERRASLSFANRHYGRVKMCFYAKGIVGRVISVPKDQTEHLITTDRTAWLDLSLGRFHTGRIKLPIDVTYEYREHIKALVRVYSKDKDGNPVGHYESGSKPDHFAHARNYAEIALPFAVSKGTAHSIKVPM